MSSLISAHSANSSNNSRSQSCVSGSTPSRWLVRWIWNGNGKGPFPTCECSVDVRLRWYFVEAANSVNKRRAFVWNWLSNWAEAYLFLPLVSDSSWRQHWSYLFTFRLLLSFGDILFVIFMTLKRAKWYQFAALHWLRCTHTILDFKGAVVHFHHLSCIRNICTISYIQNLVLKCYAF